MYILYASFVYFFSNTNTKEEGEAEILEEDEHEDDAVNDTVDADIEDTGEEMDKETEHLEAVDQNEQSERANGNAEEEVTENTNEDTDEDINEDTTEEVNEDTIMNTDEDHDAESINTNSKTDDTNDDHHKDITSGLWKSLMRNRKQLMNLQ